MVVATLEVSSSPPRANTLYDSFRRESPEVLREGKTLSFKGFVKIINSFPEVEGTGYGVKSYVLKGKN